MGYHTILPVVIDKSVVESVTVEEDCQAWRGRQGHPSPDICCHPDFFWTPMFSHPFVAMLAGASTTLGSLAATAGGGEAALCPGLAPRCRRFSTELAGVGGPTAAQVQISH